LHEHVNGTGLYTTVGADSVMIVPFMARRLGGLRICQGSAKRVHGPGVVHTTACGGDFLFGLLATVLPAAGRVGPKVRRTDMRFRRYGVLPCLR
jgi:hypothetical protein